MKTKLTLFLMLLTSTTLLAQKIDSLNFYSKAFDKEKTIYVITPMFYKYQSEEVKLPVIYILDGQHEWFVNPLLSTIKYLQNTHQIPQAIIVSIPILDRYKECGIMALDGEVLPLHEFITKEVDEQIEKYRPNEDKTLIGHSFSASFALYSYLKTPTYYSAIIANTPLDSFRGLVKAFEKNEQINKSNISISVGGIRKDEDFPHRKEFDTLKSEFPNFFNTINTFVADNSKHNAVPILSNPFLLTRIFSKFKSRYSNIALVNDEYKLISKPSSIIDEVEKINVASKIGDYFYPPELPELNGIASRYNSGDLKDYTKAIYEMGIKYYPNYYGFHFQLYELQLPSDKESAKVHLNKAYELLNTVETDMPKDLKQEEVNNINSEKKKNGW